jgi:hypothetical protein
MNTVGCWRDDRGHRNVVSCQDAGKLGVDAT